MKMMLGYLQAGGRGAGRRRCCESDQNAEPAGLQRFCGVLITELPDLQRKLRPKTAHVSQTIALQSYHYTNIHHYS